MLHLLSARCAGLLFTKTPCTPKMQALEPDFSRHLPCLGSPVTLTCVAHSCATLTLSAGLGQLGPTRLVELIWCTQEKENRSCIWNVLCFLPICFSYCALSKVDLQSSLLVHTNNAEIAQNIDQDTSNYAKLAILFWWDTGLGECVLASKWIDFHIIQDFCLLIFYRGVQYLNCCYFNEKNESVICTKILIFKASTVHLAKTSLSIYQKPPKNKNFKKGWEEWFYILTTDLTGNNSFEKLDKVTNLNQRIKFIEISNFCECPFIRMDWLSLVSLSRI